MITIKIRHCEIGLCFRDGRFRRLLGPGRHWFFDPLGRIRVDIVSQLNPWLVHRQLDEIIRSGALQDQATVLEVAAHERALAHIDGRFSHVLPPGVYVYWHSPREVAVERIDARQVHFEHKQLDVITRSPLSDRVLEIIVVEPDHVGEVRVDGRYSQMLPPGRFAFWRNVAKVEVPMINVRAFIAEFLGD